jgi:hypothetical protein
VHLVSTQYTYILSKQVEEEIIGCTNNVEAVTVPMNIAPSSDLVSAACLKPQNAKEPNLIRSANLQRKAARRRIRV